MIDLEQFAANLAAARDQSIDRARKSVTEGGREYQVGRATGLRHALTLLHAWTDGQYGADDRDQPDPFDVPILV